MSKELSNIKENSNSKDIFPEHEFLSSCLRIGLTISDLKELKYIDVMKIFFTFVGETQKKERKATQSDIDKLLG